MSLTYQVNGQRQVEETDEHFQESTSSIIHCQHVKGYSLVPVNFSFFLHIPQRHIFCC
jgi:hypothetical protein